MIKIFNKKLRTKCKIGENLMKNFFITVILVMTVFTSTSYATDDMVIAPAPTATTQPKDIDVVVNGEKLVLDVAPVIVNDRTMVPMRAIFEALDAKVNWIQSGRIIIATKDELMITMQIDNPNMVIERTNSTDKEVIALDVAPFIMNSRTLVPARAVSEALKAKVDWEHETRTVIIVKN